MGWWRVSTPPIARSPASTAAPTGAATASPAAWRVDGRLFFCRQGRRGGRLAALTREWRHDDPPPPEAPLLEMREHRQGISRRRRAEEYRLRPAARRSARDSGRERRRQVDAGQDPLRRRHAARRAKSGSTARRIQIAGPACARRHGIAMVYQETSLVPDADGRAKPLSGRRKVLQPPARHLYRGAAIASVAELSRRSDGDRPVARHREAADGRDRASGSSQGEDHHIRRADRDPDPGGEASSLRA